jgi:hypothetical protein
MLPLGSVWYTYEKGSGCGVAAAVGLWRRTPRIATRTTMPRALGLDMAS